MTRYEKGLQQLKMIDGKAGEDVIACLENIAPDLAKYIIEFAFGDIYTRKQLSLAEREIITLSSLLTAGSCEAQLKVHIQAALHIGISPQKIIEIFIQCIPYTGFAKVLNAVFTAQQLFYN
ncbi:carboxymuconolactone decarboxylase family protein [Clostridium sp. MD294]|uniref:carboxymuconolactone decarboxylase family protein n=1 Tax=Clostridium sp. MD294 TaxID=97138 RepID=UPI0002CC5723|nr:carboxymuconolactone decarboxylase family protein [Clostridium sp. MD294]NDO47805.1 carboxymuconolactone decarboxylase family protein [Clostridium sp. MD294]USF29875.1 hypothetical protein C820_001283 [Clostridium sp. MD294]